MSCGLFFTCAPQGEAQPHLSVCDGDHILLVSCSSLLLIPCFGACLGECCQHRVQWQVTYGYVGNGHSLLEQMGEW